MQACKLHIYNAQHVFVVPRFAVGKHACMCMHTFFAHRSRTRPMQQERHRHAHCAEALRTIEKSRQATLPRLGRRIQRDAVQVCVKPVLHEQHPLQTPWVLAHDGYPLDKSHEILVPVAPEQPRDP